MGASFSVGSAPQVRANSQSRATLTTIESSPGRIVPAENWSPLRVLTAPPSATRFSAEARTRPSPTRREAMTPTTALARAITTKTDPRRIGLSLVPNLSTAKSLSHPGVIPMTAVPRP